jgi:heme exporter protein C
MLGRSQRRFAGYGVGLRTLSIATVVAMTVNLGLIFFWVPLEAEQGFLQKIFYVHVPLAITSLGGFIVGGIFAAIYLKTRDRRWDLRSYVTIHMSIIFAVGTLITGSIWAKGSWGHWWVWNEPELVSFLIVFLLYCCYQPLRFSIEDPERQSVYAAVFAITAGVFVPLCFTAVRLSTVKLHPQVFNSTSDLPWQMSLMFLISFATIVLLFTTLCKYELTSKHARAQLRTLRKRLAGENGAPVRRVRSAAPLGPVAPEPRAYSGQGSGV